MRGFELTFARRGITIYGMKPLKEKLIRFPVYQWLEIGFCLCFVGGFLDAYTYVSRGGVFANAQTGNLVLLALGFARGDGLSALRYLTAIFRDTASSSSPRSPCSLSWDFFRIPFPICS